MIKATHTIMKKFWLASLLASLVALSLSFAGASSAFAATGPHNNVPPKATTNHCLHESSAIGTAGPNQINITGSTYSVCGGPGITTNVTQKIQVTNGCEGTQGTGPSTLYDGFQIPWQDYGQAEYSDKVGCVTCQYTQHVLTGEIYPNFTMFVTVTASGSYKQGNSTIIAADTGPAQTQFTVQNDGLYAPPCPPTD